MTNKLLKIKNKIFFTHFKDQLSVSVRTEKISFSFCVGEFVRIFVFVSLDRDKYSQSPQDKYLVSVLRIALKLYYGIIFCIIFMTITECKN